MMSIFNQPYPHEVSAKKQLGVALLCGLLVFLFLRIFQPFGLNRVEQSLTLLTALYGAITFSIVAFSGYLQLKFPQFFSEKEWTVGKNILLYAILIFIIGIGNFLLTVSFLGIPISFFTFLSFQFFTITVGLMVVSALTMIRYARLLKHYRSGAETMDKLIGTPDAIAAPLTTDVVITSENEKEKFQFSPDAILYIESADNYCKVIHRQNKEIRTTIIRSTLKRIESMLPEGFFRCHRSFIVRVKNIRHVSGNSQGYRLHFEHTTETIPVARGSGRELKERLGS